MHTIFRHPKICPLVIALLIPLGVLADISILRENGKLIVNAGINCSPSTYTLTKIEQNPFFIPYWGQEEMK